MPEETLGKLGFVRVREGRAGQVAFELLAREGSHMSTLAKLPKVKARPGIEEQGGAGMIGGAFAGRSIPAPSTR